MEYLGDEFTNSTGEFLDYFVISEADLIDGIYNPVEPVSGSQGEQLSKQKHTDIRAIEPKTPKILATMLHMTALFDMQSMNSKMMDQLGSIFLASVGEIWTKGTIERDPSRNNWPVLTFDCAANQEASTRSVLRR